MADLSSKGRQRDEYGGGSYRRSCAAITPGFRNLRTSFKGPTHRGGPLSAWRCTRRLFFILSNGLLCAGTGGNTRGPISTATVPAHLLPLQRTMSGSTISPCRVRQDVAQDLPGHLRAPDLAEDPRFCIAGPTSASGRRWPYAMRYLRARQRVLDRKMEANDIAHESWLIYRRAEG